ncbi:hypothetical protein [Burkholderia cepacia]|uniref:hypothetical protein n=1 Tax=Burkholderia cepacia TaxID=292 RepID=UPI002AB7E38C|nr:hypothetical protein [Burkholderia cepacia]
MKISKRATRIATVVRITYERDHDHEIWYCEGTSVPTPKTVPDAFYPVHTPTFPRQTETSSRRMLPRSISRTALRKRLYRAGLKGDVLNRTASEILRGPAIGQITEGHLMLGWELKAFEARFGRRVTRILRRCISTYLLLMDEASMLLGENAEVFARLFATGRKVGGSLVAEQAAPVA